MQATAIALLLLSATLHTAWNVMLKGLPDKYIATWWVVVCGAVISLPGLAFTGLPPRPLWFFVTISVLSEVLYFLLLSRAYGLHEFSLIYPFARGAAPAILALWSVLFLHERLTAAGLVGLAMIVGGLLVIGASAFRAAPHGTIPRQGIAAALGIALLISLYTLIDGAAVKRGTVLPYALTVFALIPIPAAPIVLRRFGWPAMARVWNAAWARLMAISVLGIAAYLLALAAYKVSPLSYAGAIREVSVVIGALAGWRLLGEEMGSVRLAGALAVFSGILLIALLG